jgi:translation initiation factor 2 subunit 2
MSSEEKIMTEPVAPTATAEAPLLTFDITMKRKKKSKTGATSSSSLVTDGDDGHQAKPEKDDPARGASQKADDPYDYETLLKRIYDTLRENNPEMSGDKRKLQLVPPQVIREGSKKTAFANVQDLAKRLGRAPEHLTSFVLAELGTTGSVDGSQRLIIKGRFQQLQMETVVRKYVLEYVTCKTCRSADTRMHKENRLFFVTCEQCGSTRSVSTIKTGFKAQIGRRIKTDG